LGALGLGFVIAVLFVIAVVNDWQAIDGLLISLVLLLFVSWVWSRFSLQRIGLRRELSMDRVRAGEVVEETLILTNYSSLPKLWIEIRDYSTLPGHAISRATHIRGKQTVEWSVSTRCVHRGRFRLGPIVAASGDPIGLYQQQRSIPGTHEVLVLPAAVDVSAIPFPADQLSGGVTVHLTSPAVSPSIAGLREYVPGDPLNHISWNATARRGMMMVKEFEPDPTADIVVLVDLNDSSRRPVMGGNPGEYRVVLDTTEEFAVSIAASLSERGLNDGRKVGLVVNRSMPVRILPDSSQRQWLRIFETLAVATSYGHRPLAEAIAAEANRLSRMTSLIVVTATRDDTWVDAIRSLTERRIPVSIVLIDDSWETNGGPELDLLEQVLVGTRAKVIRYATNTVQAGPQSDRQRRIQI
jgi:uncharacterized protein (DUF58 family)